MHATTTLGFAMLGLLHQQPRNGYALRKFFEDSPMGSYSSSPGAIYPALRRLEDKGLIRGRVRGKGSLNPSKVYRPTQAGTRALGEWLRSPITRDDVVSRMDELALRFAFMDQLDEPGWARRFLGSLAEEIEAYVEELVDLLAEMKGRESVYGCLALECGIDSYRAHARWARRSIGALEAE